MWFYKFPRWFSQSAVVINICWSWMKTRCSAKESASEMGFFLASNHTSLIAIAEIFRLKISIITNCNEMNQNQSGIIQASVCGFPLHSPGADGTSKWSDTSLEDLIQVKGSSGQQVEVCAAIPQYRWVATTSATPEGGAGSRAFATVSLDRHTTVACGQWTRSGEQEPQQKKPSNSGVFWECWGF